jgi:hypothetical protein
MQKTKIHFKSAEISKERIQELAAAPFLKKSLSAEERANDKETLLILFIGVGMIIASIVLAIIAGSSDNKLLAYLFLFLFFGGIWVVYKALPAFIYLFRNKRSKTPEKAISAFFECVLIGDDDIKFARKSVSYAYHYLRQITPENISVNYNDFEDYLTHFRNAVKQIFASNYREIFNVKSPPTKYVYKVDMCDYGKEEITSSKTIISHPRFAWVFTTEKDNKAVPFAEFEVTLDLLLIKSGKFWFVADPMPEYTGIKDETTTETESEPDNITTT